MYIFAKEIPPHHYGQIGFFLYGLTKYDEIILKYIHEILICLIL